MARKKSQIVKVFYPVSIQGNNWMRLRTTTKKPHRI